MCFGNGKGRGDEIISELEKEKWWDKSEDWIRESVESFSDPNGLFTREGG